VIAKEFQPAKILPVIEPKSLDFLPIGIYNALMKQKTTIIVVNMLNFSEREDDSPWGLCL
jgi:hypothetical protein